MERGALKGHGALLLANVIWGLNSPICKTVLLSPENPEGLNHFALTVYRLVGAFLLFWLASAFLPRERVAWRDLGGLFIASLFGIQLDQILFLWGLSLTSPINVSIIATTVPILTMILAMFFLREPITPLKTGGVLLGAAGAVLLILISSRGESGGGSIAGDIITFVSSVCYAIYLTACRKVILKYSPVTTMKWMFFFAAIVVVVLYHRPALEVDFPAVPARVWGGAAFAIVLSTFLAYLMVPIAQHYLRGVGLLVLAATVTLACLKTSVALITSCSETFVGLFPKGPSYRVWAIVFCLMSFVFANLGLSTIISYAVPVLMFLYPLAIALILLALFGKFFGHSREVYVSTLVLTLVGAVYDLLRNLPENLRALLHLDGLIEAVGNVLPLSGIGFGWVCPAIIGLAIGLLLHFSRRKKAA